MIWHNHDGRNHAPLLWSLRFMGKGFYETTLAAVFTDGVFGRGACADLHAVAVGRIADFDFEFGVGGGGDGEIRSTPRTADVRFCVGVDGLGLVLGAFFHA